MNSTVDQFPSVRPPPYYSDHDNSTSNNICSDKQPIDQTDRTKYQLTNRSTSLPSRRPSLFSNANSIHHHHHPSERRRHAASHSTTTTRALAVLTPSRDRELSLTTNATQHDHYALTPPQKPSQPLHPARNLPREPHPMSMSLSPPSTPSFFPSQSIAARSILSNKNSIDTVPAAAPGDEISAVIDLLLVRVDESLVNEKTLAAKKSKKKRKKKSRSRRKSQAFAEPPPDRHLLDYLDYLFTKFIDDNNNNNNNDCSVSMIDKTNFITVCQTLVRNGCFNLPSVPTSEPVLSASPTITTDTSNELNSTQTLVREYHPQTDNVIKQISLAPEHTDALTSNDQDTWLVVDIEPPTKSDCSPRTSTEPTCLLPTSTTASDDQLLIGNDNYFSVEEIKSCGSDSSHSNYYSPNSSLVDLQTMVHEFDDTANHNHNNNNNNTTLFHEDGPPAIDHAPHGSHVIRDELNSRNAPNLCPRLARDRMTSHDEVPASPSIEISEYLTATVNERMSRREKKMQERWTLTRKADNDQSHEPVATKTFLGVEFPPIAVLRRKFSAAPGTPSTTPTPVSTKKKDVPSTKSKPSVYRRETHPSLSDDTDKSTDSSLALDNQAKQQTAITTSSMDVTNHEQVLAQEQSNDVSSMNGHNATSNDHDPAQPASPTISETSMKLDLDSPLDPNQEENLTNTISIDVTAPVNTNPLLPSSSLLLLISPSSSSSSSSTTPPSSSCSPPPPVLLTTNPNESKPNEQLEEEEEETDGEVHCNGKHVDVEEKNNCNAELKHDVSGIILINDESIPTVVEQEKEGSDEQAAAAEEERPPSPHREKQQPSFPLLTRESCNQQRSHDDFPGTRTLADQTAMANNDEADEQRYKLVELEEIPDDDEEILTEQTKNVTEPTDYIQIDDEPAAVRQSSPTTTTDLPTSTDLTVKFDTVLACYEKALASVGETTDDTSSSSPPAEAPPAPATINQRPEDDPIALRALQRFEQRMNAAVTAKSTIDETTASAAPAKPKSSWSGSLLTPRKSMENLSKLTPPSSQSTSELAGDESTVTPPPEPFIRARPTVLDESLIDLDVALNLCSTSSSQGPENNDHESEEQEQPTAQEENDNTQIVDKSPELINPEDDRTPANAMIDTPLTSESVLDNEQPAGSTSLDSSPMQSTFDALISNAPAADPQSLTPYRLQLEGRRRLNTLERIRERHQSQEPNPLTPQQQQLQNEYTLKPEEVQDPIIRRALERFDEKSRSLAQLKPTNYDNIQDPITRRALMRLETNLKRTMPSHPPAPAPDSNGTWYTNNYTLGSLQPQPDHRPSRYADLSMGNGRVSHMPIHPRGSSTDMLDLTNSTLSNDDQNMPPPVRLPTQPMYTASNTNHQAPLSLRQRSRSEDMLSSKELSLGPTANLDDNDSNQLQRNHSSDRLQSAPSADEPAPPDSEFSLPTTLVKSLDPNFVRTNEASINYATPTQSYSAYTCEYTRPRLNHSLASSKSELTSPGNLDRSNDMGYSTSSSSAFAPVHPSTNNYYSQPPLPIPSYGSAYTNNNLHQTPYSDDPIVRRALERFNSQMQNSLMTMSQHQPPANENYMPRQYSNGYLRQGSTDSFYSTDSNQYDGWNNPAGRPPTGSSGYQSIIGRRRQMRQDDVYLDPSSVGNGYSASLFVNAPNPYPPASHYMNLSDEPPAVPPRFPRELYHDQHEYLSDNMNNNNNNYHHHHQQQQQQQQQQHHHPAPAYSGPMNGFRPINNHYYPTDAYNQYADEDHLRHRAQSTSSTTSSDSVRPIRLIHQRLPPTMARTHVPHDKQFSLDHSQYPSGQTTPNYGGSAAGDSVFQRLAYTGTKSSLSKSSSNLCANLLNKPLQSQPPPTQSVDSKPHEIDFDDSTDQSPTENHQEPMNNASASAVSKCQRSRSVDGRARLKNAQNRMNNNGAGRPDGDDPQANNVPSSKFTSMIARRDTQPARPPMTPRSSMTDRTSTARRTPSTHNLTYARNGHSMRTRSSNGNLVDAEPRQANEIENDENASLVDPYQPKIIDNRLRAAIPPPARYAAQHHPLQSSASTSSVNSTMSRAKPPLPTHFDTRDSNASGTDLNRSAKRGDDTRVLSPNVQRRHVPVSVFVPAKLDSKRPAPAPPTSPSPTMDLTSIYSQESQQQNLHSSRSSMGGESSSQTTPINENEMNSKLSSMNATLKSSTGNLLKEFSLSTDKHDSSKKMNVFERLFRGHKKKV